MGHYDDIRQQDEAEKTKKEIKKIQEDINKKIEKMDLSQLRIMATIAKHIKDFQQGIEILNILLKKDAL